MKTKTIAATALIAILLSIIATAAVASTGGFGFSTNTQGQNNGQDHQPSSLFGGNFIGCNSLTMGQTFTISGLTGHYVNASNREQGGSASGTFSFKVTGKYVEGCTLSITSGSFMLGPTTYAITGGSIVLNRGGRSGEGTGTTSTGTFLFSLSGLRGTTTAVKMGAVGLDFQTGKNEFLVQLHFPMTGGEHDND